MGGTTRRCIRTFRDPRAMTEAHRVFRVCGVLLVSACAPSWRTAHSDYLRNQPDGGARIIMSAQMGCPIAGMPLSLAQAALGKPHSVRHTGGAPSAVQWQYDLDKAGSILHVDLDSGYIVDWKVRVAPGTRVPAGGTYLGRRISSPRMRYLLQDDTVRPDIAFAITRGCPVSGMTAGQVAVTLGQPAVVDTTGGQSGPLARWFYRTGLEGQGIRVLFAADTVVAWEVERGILGR